MFKIFFKKVFTRRNLTKVLIIFFVGLFSRFLIHYFLSVNVFVDYNNIVSYVYYLFMAGFVVLVQEFVDLYNVSILPSFTFLSKIFKPSLFYLTYPFTDNKHFIIKNTNLKSEFSSSCFRSGDNQSDVVNLRNLGETSSTFEDNIRFNSLSFTDKCKCKLY